MHKLTRYSLLVMVLMSSIILFGQEHLKFKNIPIDGKTDDFIKLLNDIGFKMVETDKECITLEGEFITRQVRINIFSTKESKIVYGVGVMFNFTYDWGTLKRDYLELKNIYQEKYGIGESDEYFTDPYSEGNGTELIAIQQKKGNYSTTYVIKEGRIILAIAPGCISIIYLDMTNGLIQSKEINKIISSDI